MSHIEFKRAHLYNSNQINQLESRARTHYSNNTPYLQLRVRRNESKFKHFANKKSHHRKIIYQRIIVIVL